MRATFDHVQPVSHGGTWDEENLRLAHRDCNERRGNLSAITSLPPPDLSKPAYGALVPFSTAWLRARGHIKS